LVVTFCLCTRYTGFARSRSLLFVCDPMCVAA